MISKDNHHTAFFLSWQLEKHYNEHHTLRPGHEASLHPPPPRYRRPCAPPRRANRSRPPNTPAPRARPSARAAAAPPAASNRAPECPCPASASNRGWRRCAAGRGSRRRRPRMRTPERACSCRTPARRRLAADPRIAGRSQRRAPGVAAHARSSRMPAASRAAAPRARVRRRRQPQPPVPPLGLMEARLILDAASVEQPAGGDGYEEGEAEEWRQRNKVTR